MANDSTRNAPQRRKRRRRGVPKALVIFLIVLALAVGGVAGFFIGKGRGNSAPDLTEELARANQRITDLETVLELADIDPNADFFDDLNPLMDELPNSPETDALSGELSGVAGNNVLVSEGDVGSLEGSIPATEPTVVAEFEGGQVLSDEVLEQYNARVNEYMLRGQNVEDYAATLLEDVLTSVVREKLIYAKAEELGLTTITEEDEQAIEQEAQQQFEDQIDFFRDFAAQDGMTEEEVREATVAYLAEQNNITLDTIREQVRESWWQKKLEDSIASDITLTEEELQQVYDQVVADQQALYAENAADYEFARRYGEEIIAYNPEGYRTFKHILLAFSAEDAAQAGQLTSQIEALDPETEADEIETLNNELDALYASLQAEADEIMDRIQDGADFDQLIEEYGDDPEMDLEPTKTTGYYVCETSTTYSPSIVQACMALENVGEISEPVRSVTGLHIIRYQSDVTPGAVPLDEIRDALTADALEIKRYDAYEQQLAKWEEEAHIVYHKEALQ